jgi:hypothetical protein
MVISDGQIRPRTADATAFSMQSRVVDEFLMGSSLLPR